tara:strand:+ start:1321 stop:2529 length:1209 start_codon:yes stop_codon:yes gene_type:complete
MSEAKEVKSEGEFKFKKKTPKIKGQGNAVPEVTKIDLSKKTEEDAIQVGETETVVNDKQTRDLPEVEKEVRDNSGEVTKIDLKEKIESPLELVEDENDNPEEITMVGGTESPNTSQEQEKVLPQTQTQDYPENVDKLIEFMKETGGTIDDYARLNADYSDVDGGALLKEYYKQAKPHLDSEEIDFVIEDSFSFDEDLDEARDIRKKKLAYKEEVAKAKSYLDSLKDKYYAEIKLRPGVNQEQQEATDFFNRYNEEQAATKVNQDRFISQTDELLNNDFKGFDFKVGEKKFRYGVKDPVKVADNQKDISTFIKTFLNDKGEVVDTKGYHKALYAARNADTIAQHFYEQGKTDAIKGQIAKDKNITTEPRKTQDGNVFVNGFKVKAISGQDSSKLKIKTRKFNN